MKAALSNPGHSAALAALLVFILTRASAAEALPTAPEVFARHLEAIGGKEKVEKLVGMRLKGEFRMPSVGFTAGLEIVRLRPNKQNFKLTPNGFGEVTGGFNGEVGWLMDPNSGARLLKGAMLDQSRDDAEFYSQFQLHDPKRVTSSETTARTQFDGRECLQVKLIWKTGREENLFFDAKTGLLAGVQKQQVTDQGSVPTTIRLQDYKKFGELLQPTRFQQKLGDMELGIDVKDYVFEAVPDKEFELPTAVKDLLRTPSDAK